MKIKGKLELTKFAKFLLITLLCAACIRIGYELAPEPITHMDCTWEAWETRSVSEEMDPRERAVVECVKLTTNPGNQSSYEFCQQFRYRVFDTVIESNLDTAELVNYFLHQMAGTGQCMALDGSYWFDMGGWNHEAIQAQEMLISWMESEQ